MTITTKVVRTFVFAFLGVFLPLLVNIFTDLSETVDWTAARSLLVAAVFASISAGIRAVIAYLPIFADDTVGLQRGGN